MPTLALPLLCEWRSCEHGLSTSPFTVAATNSFVSTKLKDDGQIQCLCTEILCDTCYFYRFNKETDDIMSERGVVGHFFLHTRATIFGGIQGFQRARREQRIARGIIKCGYYEQPATILPEYLYLGSQYSACNRSTLEELDISAVLVCGVNPPRFFHRSSSGIWGSSDSTTSTIVYHRIPIDDSIDQPLLPYLPAAVQFLEHFIVHKKQRVLVHCAMGISRSAAVVIAYLMKQHRWDYDTAKEYVQAKRPIICPNPRFAHELRQEWYRYCTVTMFSSANDTNSSGSTTERNEATVPSLQSSVASTSLTHTEHLTHTEQLSTETMTSYATHLSPPTA